jgi:hypothetical protein
MVTVNASWLGSGGDEPRCHGDDKDEQDCFGGDRVSRRHGQVLYDDMSYFSRHRRSRPIVAVSVALVGLLLLAVPARTRRHHQPSR